MAKKVEEVKEFSSKEKRRRLNIVLETVKIRKDNNAIKCLNDDCDKIIEMPIISKRNRRRGNGSLETLETDTGNIIFECDVHGWRHLFSVSQLDNLKMPSRTTTVSSTVPNLTDPESNVVER